MTQSKNNCDLNFLNNQTQLSSVQVIQLPGWWSGNNNYMWHTKNRSGQILTVLGNSAKQHLYHPRTEPPLKCPQRNRICVLACVPLASSRACPPVTWLIHRQPSRGKTYASQLNGPRTTIYATETRCQGTAHACTVLGPLLCSCWALWAHANSQTMPRRCLGEWQFA